MDEGYATQSEDGEVPDADDVGALYEMTNNGLSEPMELIAQLQGEFETLLETVRSIEEDFDVALKMFECFQCPSSLAAHIDLITEFNQADLDNYISVNPENTAWKLVEKYYVAVIVEQQREMGRKIALIVKRFEAIKARVCLAPPAYDI